MATATKAYNGAVETTDVKVGDTVTYIDGQCGIHFDAQVLGVSAEGRVADLSHPDPKQPRRNAVQYSDDGVWHSWHFKAEDAPPAPAPEGMIQENPPLSDSYTKTADTPPPFDPLASLGGTNL